MGIKLLDCTLRDGGYVNDWMFGEDNIQWIIQKLQNARMDIIELGYIRDKEKNSPDRAIFSDTYSTNNILKSLKKSEHSLISAMIDYGACAIENICPQKETEIDILRVTFRKKEMNEALEYCKQIKEKGYTVFIQPVSITSYSDKEMLDLIEKINKVKPLALSIVDSYGLMHEEKVIRYFYLMDNNLLPEIGIAYHSHNNFQLAYSNSIKILNIHCKRDLYFDASLYGMGKSAGNCNTELLAMYLNNNCGKNYDLGEILDIIDIQIMKLAKQYKWGYQLPFFISALNDCHPNYVNYLLSKNMLTVKEINEIVNTIDKTKHLVFDESYIENLYQNYQKRKVDDKDAYIELEAKFKDATVLLLGSGKSIAVESDKISYFIKNDKPIVFSVNHLNRLYDTNYVFISNAKRYEQFNNMLSKYPNKIIITSNIIAKDNHVDYVFNWQKLASKDTIVGASSIYLLIKLLIRLKVKKILLAGFDGFSKYTSNHYDRNCEFYSQPENVKEITKAITEQLGEFQKHIEIEFITKSKYDVQGR